MRRTSSSRSCRFVARNRSTDSRVVSRQSLLDPPGLRGLEPRDVPATTAHREGEDLLEQVAPGGDELRVELPYPLRVKGHREPRGAVETLPDRFGDLDPQEGIRLGDARPGLPKGIHYEGPPGGGVAHAATSSLTGRKASSFLSCIRSYSVRARTSASPRRCRAARRSSASRSAQISIIMSSKDRRSARLPRMRSSSPTTSSNMWILRSRSSIR